MISPSREADRVLRLEYLQETRKALALKLPLTAKACGAMSAFLAKKMKTHDYTTDDAFLVWFTKSFPSLT